MVDGREATGLWRSLGVQNQPDSGFDPQAVVSETTVHVETCAVGLSKTRCVSFLPLYGMDQVCLLYVPRDEAERLGFFPHFW